MQDVSSSENDLLYIRSEEKGVIGERDRREKTEKIQKHTVQILEFFELELS